MFQKLKTYMWLSSSLSPAFFACKMRTKNKNNNWKIWWRIESSACLFLLLCPGFLLLAPTPDLPPPYPKSLTSSETPDHWLFPGKRRYSYLVDSDINSVRKRHFKQETIQNTCRFYLAPLLGGHRGSYKQTHWELFMILKQPVSPNPCPFSV